MAGQVIGTEIRKEIVAYRYRSTLLGSKILQVRWSYQDWDTNTGINDGPPYKHWGDATKEELEEAVSILNKQLNRKKKKKEQQNG